MTVHKGSVLVRRSDSRLVIVKGIRGRYAGKPYVHVQLAGFGSPQRCLPLEQLRAPTEEEVRRARDWRAA